MYTDEDAESDYQMSIEKPICPVCKDTGFINVEENGFRYDKPCTNCRPKFSV